MWSMPTGITTPTGASTTLVASHVPPSPTSTTADDTGASANATNASTVSTSKNVSGRPPSVLDDLEEGRTSSHAATNRSVADRLPVERDPLAHGLQVRAGEPSGAQAERAQQRIDHAARSTTCRWSRPRGSTGRRAADRPAGRAAASTAIQRRLDLRLRAPAGSARSQAPTSRSPARLESARRVTACESRCGAFSTIDSPWTSPSPPAPIVPRPGEADHRRHRGHLGGRYGKSRAPTASTGPRPATDLLDRHSSTHRQRVTSRRTRLQLHAHRHHRPLSSACAAKRSSTPWAGTTTACRPNAACRTTTASAATRRFPTTPTSRHPTSPGKQQLPIADRNFVELCEQLTAEDEQVFEAAVAAPRTLSRLDA